jgi:AraC-like DNA-binding protein
MKTLDPGRYFGEALGATAQGSFSLQMTRYVSGERLPVHTHALPYVCFVLDGDYREHSGGDERACSAGTVIVHRGGAAHSDLFGRAGGTCLNVAWDGDGGARLVRRIGRALPIGAWRAPRVAALGSALADAACSPSLMRADFVCARMSELAEELVRAANGAESHLHEPRWLAIVESRIETRLEAHESELDVAELARACGVHRTTLFRAFRRYRGSSVSEAVRKKRLERAIAAILATDASLAELALLLGYADQSHLCRMLRATTGTSPARLRRASCVQEPPPDVA